jgi:hypothetical protein
MANLKGKTIQQVLETNKSKVHEAQAFLERRRDHLLDRLENSRKNLSYDRVEADAIAKVVNAVDDLYFPPLEDETFQEFWRNYFQYYFNELQIDISNVENIKKLMNDIYAFAQIKPWVHNITIDTVIEEEAQKEFVDEVS